MRKAFSLTELVFAIIILAILAAFAIPRLNFGKENAELAQAKMLVQEIRASISSKYNQSILTSIPAYPNTLDDTGIFDKILPLKTKPKGWEKESENKYELKIDSQILHFTYDPKNGEFECDFSNKLCEQFN
ncbi:MAG: prepilin-type N-terminal cleavage/methylation domain-containing protein [Campylobacter sp.]|nr:prepilin-type N-terminal cleavage/methylation domain-containing protein [Campylobacter sp.]